MVKGITFSFFALDWLLRIYSIFIATSTIEKDPISFEEKGQVQGLALQHKCFCIIVSGCVTTNLATFVGEEQWGSRRSFFLKTCLHYHFVHLHKVVYTKYIVFDDAKQYKRRSSTILLGTYNNNSSFGLRLICLAPTLTECKFLAPLHRLLFQQYPSTGKECA